MDATGAELEWIALVGAAFFGFFVRGAGIVLGLFVLAAAVNGLFAGKAGTAC